jgi:branched-chain amino acid transport system ATP-binding protein
VKRDGRGDEARMVALLSAEGLQRQFGGVTAVDGVDLAVGRWELRWHHRPQRRREEHPLQHARGTVRPTAGRIRFEGRDVVGLPPTRSRGSASPASSRYRACSRR